MTASVKIDIAKDTILVGIGASPGIAIARSHLVNRARVAAIERRIASEEVRPKSKLSRQPCKNPGTQLAGSKKTSSG